MTRNFGEWPSEEKESRLSWILEDNPPQKYYLSKKACLGILHRAERRGKELPECLKIALQLQAGLNKPMEPRGGALRVSLEKSYTLRAEHEAVICIQENCIDRSETAGCNGKGWTENMSFTLNTIDRHAVFDSRGLGNGETVNTLQATNGHNNQEPIVMKYQSFGEYKEDNIASTMKSRDYKDGTDLIIEEKSVRRLTPLECERLQGFPDYWTNIPGATDSKRYKALGNSIALPFWEHLAKRLVQIGNVKTIGSLFDGIGGFPLCFKRAGAETLWISEIEPFCQKVTAYHFCEG